MHNIPCPKRKLVNMLEVLYNPAGFFRTLQRNEQEDPEKIFREIYPGLPEEILKRLIRRSKAELLRNKGTYSELEKYAHYSPTRNLLSDASYVLGEHIKECRDAHGCLDNYMLWLERRARELLSTGRYDGNEESLPKIIRILDHKMLGIDFSSK